MPFRKTATSLLVQRRPEEAKAKILAAVRRTGGRMGAAAEMLGVTHRTLDRWVLRLGLSKQVEQIQLGADGWSRSEAVKR